MSGEPRVLYVDRDNVLQVRNLVLDEYDRLDRYLAAEINSSAYETYRYGDDPVSKDAAIAFPQRFGLLVASCRKQLEHLARMGEALAEAARQYGYTEDQIISAAFRSSYTAALTEPRA